MLDCELSNDRALLDEVTLRGLKYGYHSTVEVKVPLSLLIQVHLNILESDFF